MILLRLRLNLSRLFPPSQRATRKDFETKGPMPLSLRAWIPTAAAVMLLALLASAAGFFWQRSKTLVRDRDQAREVTRFLVDQFHLEPANGGSGEPRSARDILDHAMATVENGSVAVPEDRAALLGALGSAYLGLGAYDEAERLLQWSLSLRQGDDTEPDSQLVIRLLDLAAVKRHRGICEEGESLQAKAARIIEESGLTDATLRRFLVERAFSLNHRRGDPRLAEILYRLSFTIESPHSGKRSLTAARTHHNLAVALELQGKYDEAREPLEQALALRRALLGDDSVEVARTLDDLEALSAKEEHLEIRERHPEEGLRDGSMDEVRPTCP